MPDALDLLLALEGAELGVWSWDPRTGETSGSARLHELIGVATAIGEVGDAPFEPLLDDEARARLRRGLTAHWREHSPYVGELRATIGGAPRVLRVRGHSVWGRNGEVLRMAGTVEDITDERREHEALRRRAEVFERAKWGMIVGSADFSRTEIVNQAFAEQRGYTIAEILATPPRELFAPEVRGAVAAEIAQAHARGRHSFESVHVRKDGSRFPVEIDVTAVRDDAGVLVHRLVNVQDISERKDWEERLRRSERMFRGVFDASPMAIFLCAADGRLTRANPAGLAVFGVREVGELAGLNLFDNPAVTPRIRGRLAAGESISIHSEVDFDRVRARGVYPTARSGVAALDWVITPLGDDGILVQIHDVTERRRAEEEARQLEQRLFQAKKMEAIGRLAGGVAHDFNNILAVISMRAELALAGLPAGSEAGRHIEGVLETSHRSVELIRQLLSFARRQVISPKVLALGETLRSMAAMLRGLVGGEVELRVELEDGLWPVRIDPAQLDQILVNLCVNARDAMASRGGTIRVQAKNAERLRPSSGAVLAERREGVLLTVRDDGAGIAADDLDQVFEPFFSTKQERHCVGLGLATVYGIVEQNGGDIRVASELGVGTAFEIWLPRHTAEERAPAPAAGPKEVAAPRGHGETILVVEDDEAVLASFHDAIESLGYRVATASSASAALRLCARADTPIAAVLTDMVMPEHSGVWLARALRERQPQLPVIFISGNPRHLGVEREEAGLGREFLSKPVSIRELGAALRRALGGPAVPSGGAGGTGGALFSPLHDQGS
ncbi:MAG: PAS domain S-box protein [Nannocystaceae bacterium]